MDSREVGGTEWDLETKEKKEGKGMNETKDMKKYKRKPFRMTSLVNYYCKSLIFSVPLYLANLANLTFSLIFKDAKLKRRQQYFSTLK